MTRFSCLLVGQNSLLIQCAELLLQDGCIIAAVATETANIRDWAVERQIPLLDPSGDFATAARAFEFDWLLSIANLRIVPDAVLRQARYGGINFHDGPLPDVAGLNTPSWSLIEGRAAHGVTWHAMTPGVDEGDVHETEAFEIGADDTALTLNTRCYEAGIASFARLLRNMMSGTLQRHRQNLSHRQYYARRRRPPAAGTLRWDRPASETSRLFRGLSFGTGYRNPLTLPKVATPHGIFLVRELTVLDRVGGVPGTVLAVDGDTITVATADHPIRISAASSRENRQLASMVHAGEALPVLSDDETARLDDALARVAPHEEAIAHHLAEMVDLDISRSDVPVATEPRWNSATLELPGDLTRPERAARILAFLARLSGQLDFDIAYTSDATVAFGNAHPGYFASALPLHIHVADGTAGAFVAAVKAAIAQTEARISYPLDLIERIPGLASPKLSVGLACRTALGDSAPIADCAMTFIVADDGTRLVHDESRIAPETVATLVARLAIAFDGFDHAAPLGAIPLVSEVERQGLLYDLNQTACPFERTACIHDLIARQAAADPNAVAVAFRGRSISYGELETQAGRIARHLAPHISGPDTIIGLDLPRGIEMVVGAYAILKAGAAYLPLDPAFPANRLEQMVADSAVPIILGSSGSPRRLGEGVAETLLVETLLETQPGEMFPRRAEPHNLAYVIFTSGSTGRPKGVMIEHRNVLNFFAGMDERVPRMQDRQDVWLAVTSLSFDISVLEIFWTLSRGFKLVIHSSELDQVKSRQETSPAVVAGIDFSLFYWGNDDGVGPEKYRTLLEGARFADEHGFHAVWTPERHFHAFGGPYPNPSVTGAAVAAVTRNIAIRAGSCVLPLHHPARVAEEWAVVDNLCGGRVGLAFASGWMPEDFVLRPENAPPNNKAAMLRDIETVRRLWRGEAVDFDLGSGKTSVVTQPRPMSKELPVWITTAGNPDTYRDAARARANVLTHLLGQSIAELADKIALYRKTLVATGLNPADFKVTLMLHTLVGHDREQVRDQARGPMKDYLRSAAALIKQYAWAFPAFKKPAGISNPMEVDLQALAPEELDAILEFAFTRYFEDSGLFGTVEDATARVQELRRIGVDEIACLIDFGLPAATVLDALVPLADVVRGMSSGTADARTDAGLAADIRREGVTHLQCTPSMAGMFAADSADRAAMASLKHLFIGGEPLKRQLVEDLRKVTAASIENMYGPTETTIWSSTTEASGQDEVVPLGSPIANTSFYVLDRWLQPLPAGEAGELFIGGEGVARGYLNRDDLTAERFLPNPFAPGRMYRTGDLVRYRPDGSLEFVGRVDNQVKIRGNRIELGEIEARLATLPGVREVVAMVREDRPGDQRIVAYLRTTRACSTQAVRAHLEADLPEHMMPAHVVCLDSFPLTPNAKVDRSRLPKPETAAPPIVVAEETEFANDAQRQVAEAFKRILNLGSVGLNENFFALGGHSLLAVQMHRDLKATLAPQLTITDIFRFPTVAGLAAHISGRSTGTGDLDKVMERAALRRAAMEARRPALARSSNAQ